MNKLIGQWGEDIVREWLINRGYKILHCRWHCRYSEIDIVAQLVDSYTLCFVEVKTRGQNNWDNNGILAIDFKKQAKLRLGGEIFLSRNACFSDWNCRFDIALLSYRKCLHRNNTEQLIVPSQLNQVIDYQGYQFQLIDYIENAF